MSALTKVEPINAISICDNIEKTKALARQLMTTKHYQKLGEDGIFAICMMAQANGVPELDALNGELYFVQGRVGMSAEAMNKYIRLRGNSISLKCLNEKGCTLIGKRKDNGDIAEVSFTIEDMKRAGKNYEKNLLDMFFARCISRLKRILFPDLLTKIYTREEMDDFKNEEKDDKGQSLIDVKPLYITCISTEKAIELGSILAKCSPEVKKNFLSYLNSKFNIDLLDDLPENEFDKHKELLGARCDEYQKKLAEAEMATIVKTDEETEC